jgi:pyruvate/2-oxoglutarate dehydrogenase complex dihydrolipoamide dehydrogenase (E3) component
MEPFAGQLVGRGLAEAGVDVRVGVPVTADGYTGRARMVVDLDRGYLLGVMFVGPGVSEL